ncbi:trigger factor, partial [bacterium]
PLYPRSFTTHWKVTTLQVTITPVSDVQQEAEIEVTSEELQPHFEKAYEKYRPKLELKGFRKGKVPLPMIKKLYGEAIERDSLDSIADDLYQKVMEEKDIHPLGKAALVDMDFKRGERFRFKIKYEVRPAITLEKYKGIHVDKEVHPVTDAEVEAEVDHIRRANASATPAETVTDPEHIVTADVQELDEAGTPLIGRKTAGARFLLSDPNMVPEIKEALSSAKAGETYRASYESKHEDHSHKANLSMSVTGVEKVTLPPLDDELVKKITNGKVTSRDEFLKSLRSDLERYWTDQTERRLADAIATEVVRLHEFAVPDALVEGFLDSFVDDIKNQSRDKKLPQGFDEQKFREESRAYAVWQAKWLLLKERIAEQEKISISKEDIEKLAEADAPRMGVTKEQLLRYYLSSGTVAERLLADKVMAFLKEHAKMTEKIVDPNQGTKLT